MKGKGMLQRQLETGTRASWGWEGQGNEGQGNEENNCWLGRSFLIPLPTFACWPTSRPCDTVASRWEQPGKAGIALARNPARGVDYCYSGAACWAVTMISKPVTTAARVRFRIDRGEKSRTDCMNRISTSYFRQHIENHFDDHDLDVVVRKRKQGYAIYWAEDEEPLAQLRPTGREGDEVEIYCWQDDRWEPAAEFGLALPLESALAHITEDPLGLFFECDSDEDDSEELDLPSHPKALQAGRELAALLLVFSMPGAAVGGLFSSVLSGLAAGALTGLVCGVAPSLIFHRLRITRVDLIAGVMCGLCACVGGITGSALHGALGSGFWPGLSGLLVGAVCNLFLFRGGLLAWLTGLAAGLNLAVCVVDAWQLREHFGGLVLVAVLAAGAASVCRRSMNALKTGYVSLLPAAGSSLKRPVVSTRG